MKEKSIKISKRIHIFIWIAIMLLSFIIKDYTSGFSSIFLAVVILAVTLFLGYGILCDKYQQRIFAELEIVNTILILFMVPSLYRCVNQIKNMVFVVAFFQCILYIWLFLLIKFWKEWICTVRNYIYQNIYMFFGIAFAVLLRIPQFGTITKWDAQIYSYCLSDACLKFDYTCDSFIRCFSIAGHTSWGYVFLSGIVEFWSPFSNYTLSILGILLTIFTFMAIYEISKRMCNMSSFFAMLSAAVVTTTPIFSGTYTYYNLDFGVACLYFIVVFCWIRKYRLLTFLFSVFLCLTKEPAGILFTAGLLLCDLLKCWDKNRKIKAFLNTSLREPSNYVFSLSILLCLGGFMKIFLSEQSAWGLVQQAESTLNFFCWNPSFMKIKSMQMLFINFAWLSVLIIIIFGIIIFAKKIKVSHDFLGILFGTFFYIVFSFLYYTYAIPRYNIIIYMVFNYIACCFITLVIQNIRFRSAVMTLLCILFSIQTYFNIDFIMLNIFPTVSTGKYLLCNTSIDQDYLGDYLVYNYMYSYFDSVILEILNDAGYSGQEEIFILGRDSDSFVGGNKQLMPIYFDTMKKNWSFLPDENGLYVESHNEDIWDEPDALLSDTALVITIPYYKFDLYEQKNRIESHYEIKAKKTVDTFYGSAGYWILNRK